MTDQEINIAIHEARGLCPHIDTKYYCIEDGNDCDSGFTCVKCGKDTHGEKVPSYTTDLNAMHEAEKVLNEKQQVWYLQKLTQVRFKEGVSGMIACMIDKTTFATARQRAEAFLRALGKLKE